MATTAAAGDPSYLRRLRASLKKGIVAGMCSSKRRIPRGRHKSTSPGKRRRCRDSDQVNLGKALTQQRLGKMNREGALLESTTFTSWMASLPLLIRLVASSPGRTNRVANDVFLPSRPRSALSATPLAPPRGSNHDASTPRSRDGHQGLGDTTNNGALLIGSVLSLESCLDKKHEVNCSPPIRVEEANV